MTHHLQCLNGSLQSSLLGGIQNATTMGNDIVSSAPVAPSSNATPQPLARPSSAITTPAQRFSPLNSKTTGRQQHQQHQHQKLNTPLLPLSSATTSMNAPTANIFFPPLPPRSNSSINNGNTAHNIVPNHPNQATSTASVANGSNKSSPLCHSADINMNVAQERNREHCSLANSNQQQAHANAIVVCNSANISPNPTRLPSNSNTNNNSTSKSIASKPHSPLSVQPTKTFAGFFSEQVTHFTSMTNNNHNSSNSTNTPPSVNQVHSFHHLDDSSPSTWREPPPDDNNYHLYHEPLDPDETSDVSKNNNDKDNTHNNKKPDDAVSNHPMSSPSWFRPSHREANNNGSQSFRTSRRPSDSPTTGKISNSAARDWTFALPPSPATPTSSVKNTLAAAGDSHRSHDRLSSSHSTTFTDRANSGRRNDVSADIYFCYVTLKSNERSNHRSRSYHGPKKTSNSGMTSTLGSTAEVADPTSPIDNQRALPRALATTSHMNFSSTSVVDLPASPAALTNTNTMMPVHLVRDHCLRELLETESNYVHALDMIITRFAKPLENTLRREDHQLIFGLIKYFHHIHSSFQTDLVKAAFRNYNKELSHIATLGKTGAGNGSSNTITAGAASSTNTNPQSSTQRSPLSSPSAQDLLALKSQSSSGNGSKSFNGAKISCCFLAMKEKFLKYGDYCVNLSKAQALLDELTSKNDNVAQQLDICQQEANEGKFKLRDLLSLPMQRILKYHLLLAQLIKNTSSTNDDYHGLKLAHETMVDLGQYINEVKRDTEAKQIINDIEQSVTGLNMPPNTRLTDYGRLVADGFIRIKASNDPKSSKQLTDAKLKQKRYIFVFDKVMLMCKLSGVRGYQYKEALVLSEFELEVNPTPSISDFSTLKHATRDKWSYGFNLVRVNDMKVFSFYAKTPEMKNKWVSAILKAMDNTRPAACKNNETNHEFLMHSFDKPSSCDHCRKLLLGLYYQGYRCQTCFTSVHKRCLTSVRPCGSILSLARPNVSHSQQPRSRFNEPSSPSLASNCSDESNALTPIPVSSSTNSFQSPTNHMRKINLSDNDLTQGQNIEQSANGYVNFILDEYPWFCGRMERDSAQSLLEKMPHGTFLVRVSPRHNGSYVISLNYNGQVKHIRIYISKDNQLYLSQNRYFKSVIELVSHYKDNSLVESFHMLDARLVTPFKLAQK